MTSTDGVDDALERNSQQTGESAKMRLRGRVGSGCFADEAHDIVTVGTIVDSGDPPRIRRTGKRNRRKEYQCHDDRKKGDKSALQRTE